MNLSWKIPKLLTALFITVLLLFYIWVFYQGRINSSLTPDTPTVIANNGFVVNIPQKALWRNYVTASVEATTGTNCGLIYISPSGKTNQMDTTANPSGLCEWRWKIEETQGKGSGRLIFTIEGKSETHFMEIWSAF